MQLTWYGTAGILLREKGDVIAFDPFGGIDLGSLHKMPHSLFGEDDLKKARDVFVTHGHFDHIYHIPYLYSGSSTTVHCTRTPARTLCRRGLDEKNIDVISAGSEIKSGAFTVKAYPGKHCHFDRRIVRSTVMNRTFVSHPLHAARLMRLNRKCREGGEILFYEVACGGKRLQIMGSMNTDPRVSYPTGADVLVLPLQGRSDLDTFALGIVKKLMPRLIILDHIDNSFPPISSDVDVSRFIENLHSSFGIPCIVPEKGKMINI